MFQFRLQAWGGRGGSLSAKNTSSTYVSGGKVATVEYYNPNNGSRIEKIRTFEKAAIRMMQRSAEHFVNGVAYRQTTLENLGEVFKKQPALSAMQTLELNSKIR